MNVMRMLCASIAALGCAWWTGWPVARAADPPFSDTIEQRVKACDACHGERGAGLANSAFPRLAGQPATYLAAQLRAFRDGRRTYAPMNFLTSRQSDAYLAEMADWFAKQTPDRAVVDPRRSASFDRAAYEAGRVLVHEGRATDRLPACVACHGATMMGMLPAIPGLAGMPRDLLVEQVGSWKTGMHRSASREQGGDCMAQVAKRMTGADIAAAATWLSLQDPVGTPEPARPLPISCGATDGRDGRG